MPSAPDQIGFGWLNCGFYPTIGLNPGLPGYCPQCVCACISVAGTPANPSGVGSAEWGNTKFMARPQICNNAPTDCWRMGAVRGKWWMGGCIAGRQDTVAGPPRGLRMGNICGIICDYLGCPRYLSTNYFTNSFWTGCCMQWRCAASGLSCPTGPDGHRNSWYCTGAYGNASCWEVLRYTRDESPGGNPGIEPCLEIPSANWFCAPGQTGLLENLRNCAGLCTLGDPYAGDQCQLRCNLQCNEFWTSTSNPGGAGFSFMRTLRISSSPTWCQGACSRNYNCCCFPSLTGPCLMPALQTSTRYYCLRIDACGDLPP